MKITIASLCGFQVANQVKQIALCIEHGKQRNLNFDGITFNFNFSTKDDTDLSLTFFYVKIVHFIVNSFQHRTFQSAIYRRFRTFDKNLQIRRIFRNFDLHTASWNLYLKLDVCHYLRSDGTQISRVWSSRKKSFKTRNEPQSKGVKSRRTADSLFSVESFGRAAHPTRVARVTQHKFPGNESFLNGDTQRSVDRNRPSKSAITCWYTVGTALPVRALHFPRLRHSHANA